MVLRKLGDPWAYSKKSKFLSYPTILILQRGSILIPLSFIKMDTPSETSISWGGIICVAFIHAHCSTTTIEVCYSLNTFIFAMDNLRLDLYGNINHYAKTNFFRTCCRALRCHFFRYQYDTDTFLIYKLDTDTILILSWSEISILILILIPSRVKIRYRY